MRVVALEEHFQFPELLDKWDLSHRKMKAMNPEFEKKLADLNGPRLRDMDEQGISVQVLSSTAPGAEFLEGQKGIDYARAVNDKLAEGIAKNPSRFAGFAHLPLLEPEAAAKELERAVKTLGFRGALTSGTTDGKFLDDPRFAPILAATESLGVPHYIHPGVPPPAVREAYYSNLPGMYSQLLSTAGFGWHAETAVHVLRLAASGTLGKYPKLKIIVGHMGEMLPFMLARVDGAAKIHGGPPLSETLLKHLTITTSGFFTLPPLLNAILTFGVDRILFSVDYPFSPNSAGRKFLDDLPLCPEDKEKIAHGNADRILGLKAV